MRKYRFITVIMALIAITTAWAEPINENQARSIAANFMANHAVPSTTLRMAHKAPLTSSATGGEKVAYYVFNANSGYVIVAGDDRAPAVLGYSDKGTFDSQDMPEAMQWLLEGYAAQIEALGHGAKPAPRLTSGAAINPLVSASWSQNSPYNTLLPMLPNGQQAVAGCVATAMAQVLYYWKDPAQVTQTLPQYTSQYYGINMPALEPVDFNWDAMQDMYLTNDTESDAAIAAARLTLYCAQSVQMNFQDGASGANTTRIPSVLSTYFGYKASARCEYREDFTTQSWANLIYNELTEGRPVIYSGSKRTGGHAFICDGYDGEGLFHINWGWDGMSNGYYLLNVLNPDAQSTGSASGAYGYIYDQYIVAGIEPGEGVSEFALTAGNVALNDAVTTRTSSNANFKATVTAFFYNYTNQTIGASFGWGLYEGDELVSVLFQSGISQLPSGYFVRNENQTLNFGQGITSGTYRLVPIYSELYANDWHPCKGTDANYIEVTIDGNDCTVTGCGIAGTRDYEVNDITCYGYMHHGRPVDINLNMTNNGYSQGDLLHMFVNGEFKSTAFVGLEHGETGDVMSRFIPSAPGEYTCVFSFNQDGSDPICQTTITVDEMPVANLQVEPEVLNVTDNLNCIITDTKFRLKLFITNNGEQPYHDDITVRLYKNRDGNYGSNVQIMNQELYLDPGMSTEMLFELDNVVDGWKYFANYCHYSGGSLAPDNSTSWYTIVFPQEQPYVLGDVNNDGVANINDVTDLIDYLLGLNTGDINATAADCNTDGAVDINDVTSLIDMLLGIS